MSFRNSAPAPPTTRREEVTETLHGVSVPDPYRWLEDQESPETRAWLQEQIAYTQSVLAAYPGREQIVARLTELMRVDSISFPRHRNGVCYYTLRAASEQQYTIYRRLEDGRVETVVDPAKIAGAAADNTTSVSVLDISRDGRLLTYGVRQGGEDELEVRTRCLQSLTDIPDVMPRGRYFGVEIDNGCDGIYYSVNTEAGPRVLYHRFGTDISQDSVLFGENVGPEKIIGVGMSEDRSWLQIVIYHGSSGTRSEIYLLNTADNSVRPLVNTLEARSDASICGDTIFLRTNWNAPNCRVFKIPIGAAPNDTSAWLEIVPEDPEAVLVSASPAGGRIYLNYLEDVTSVVRVIDADGLELPGFTLPGIGAVQGPFGDWTDTDAYFSYTSFVTPIQVWKLHCATGQTSLWASPNVPLDAANVSVTQVFFTSKDGTRVPMFLVHKAGLPKDGHRPVYMTGYGGFNISRTPAFSALAAEWAENDGIYVLVNLRGGGEYGEQWHQAGMRANKQNVFDDLYAAAEWLIESGWSSAQHIAVAGRSNGGLLVGAAITQRPDLFGAVVCGYPLLDMVRYHQFLVAGYWVPEYGSSEDAEQFGWLHAYSPYHHVKPDTAYPPIMFVTGDADTRVAPLHARKMAALMQHCAAPGTPVLLNYDVKSGHSEGKPIGHVVEDTADEILFLRTHTG